MTRFDDVATVTPDTDNYSASNALATLTPACPAAREVLNSNSVWWPAKKGCA